MSIELTSLDYTLQLLPEEGSFSILPHDERFPAIQAARLEVRVRQAGHLRSLLDGAWRVVDAQHFSQPDSPHGVLQGVVLSLAPFEGGLRVQLTFALFPEKPLVLWKVRLSNLGSLPCNVERIELLRAAPAGWLESPQPAFFCNGWQSWAYSAAYGAQQGIRRTRLGFIQGPLVANPGTPQHRRPGAYSSDFFGVLGDRHERRGLVLGMLTERQHFASLEALLRPPSLRLWANGDSARLDAGQSIETDWAALSMFQLDQPDPLGTYLDAVAHENGIPSQAQVEAPAGWCSWYQFYQHLGVAQVEQNLAALLQLRERLPLSLVQIDDGFERQVGDWLEFSLGFPHGVADLAARISQSGLTPGLWLAPFIVRPGANLLRQHPDWILRGAFNRPVNAGFVWDRFTTALDLTHPEALEYACRVVRMAAQEWGFPYLKLDFLYAGALAGKHRDPTRSRAQVLRGALEALRQAAGVGTYLLGCGVPLGSALGLFEAMRIGADVSAEWAPSYQGLHRILSAEPHMPSARNSIQNILTRANLHRRWWINDPDCLLLRPDSRLSLEEVHSLASVIAMSGGSLLVSDDLPRLPQERLRIAEVLLPVLPERVEVLDWLDATTPRRLFRRLRGAAGDWVLVGYFNWDDHPEKPQLLLEDFHLPAGEYWARSFWDGITRRWNANQPLQLDGLAPHAGVLLAVRPVQGAAQYLGSDLHFSQGLEVSSWQVAPHQVRLGLQLPRRVSGEVELLLPAAPLQAVVNGAACPWRALGQSRYAFRLAFDRQAELVVDFAPHAGNQP